MPSTRATPTLHDALPIYKAFVKEPEMDGRAYCPRCGTLGIAVSAGPLDTHIQLASRAKMHDAAWFCSFPQCEVAYFNVFETVRSEEHTSNSSHLVISYALHSRYSYPTRRSSDLQGLCQRAGNGWAGVLPSVRDARHRSFRRAIGYAHPTRVTREDA